MARKLKPGFICLLLGLFTAGTGIAVAQDVPQLRTLDRGEVHAAANEAKPESVTTVKNDSKKADAKTEKKDVSLPDAPVASKQVKKQLSDRVQAILNEKTLSNTVVGIHVVDMDTGDVVYAHNAEKLLKPASNNKLLTTAAAVSILGADHQFESALYAKGKIVNGVLKGDLQLHIDHDFTWSTRFYEAGDVPMRGLINQLRNAGITKIEGNVIVSGYVVYGGSPTGTLSTAAHLRRAGNQFGALLKKNKISYASLAINQTQKPDGKKVATWLSPILSEAIVPLNRVSHNEYADTLMLALGQLDSGKNTYEAGAAAVKKWLQKTGLYVKGVEQHDGSGLSHDNHMTAQFFTNLVAYMLKSPAGREWAASLAISGYDGTYGGRLSIDEGKGRVYAKSGTLRDTISGSGFFVNMYDGHTYAFSIIVNGMRNKKTTRQSIDRIVRVFLGNHLNAKLPAVPQMQSFMKDQSGAVIAKWDEVKNVEGYRVYKSSDGLTWTHAADTTDNSLKFEDKPTHIRVTSVAKSGIESLPSLIFSYRPGKKNMTIVETAKCRPDEAMRPVNHFIAHERPLASFVGSDWGIQTVRKASELKSDGLLYHSVACNGAISWNADDFKKSYRADIPVIVNVADAYYSADTAGNCDPASGRVLGCYGEAVVAKDRRLGERSSNYRLRKAAGTGSTRPSLAKTWTNGKSIMTMSDATVVTQEKTAKGGSITIVGFDIQSLDSDKTMNSVWKNLNIDKK